MESLKPFETMLTPSIGSRIAQATKNISLQKQHQWFIGTLVISDILMALAAFWLAYAIRFQWGLTIFKIEFGPDIAVYKAMMIALVPIWIGICISYGLYDMRHLLGGIGEYSRVFQASTMGMLLVVILSFLFPGFILARGWLIMVWVLTWLLVGFARAGIRRFVYSLRHKGYFLSSALIVGANAEGVSLAEQLIRWRTSGLHIVGFVDNIVQTGQLVHHRLTNLGQVSQLDHIIKKYAVSEIILATSALTRDEKVNLFEAYGVNNNINVRLSSGLFEIITTGVDIDETAYVPLLRIRRVRLKGLDVVMKTLLDYSLALLSLVSLAPLMGVIALLVKLDSAGPIMYRRRVMGLNGKQFDAYKFRTMHINGDEILAQHPELQQELAENHKLKDDPRITRMGRFLRKTSLDELLQLFNVLQRQMSIVGPRMIAPNEMEKYGKWGMNLLTVRPGITGLWQVSGRSDVSYEQRVQLDMRYIRNWNIWLDLHILWRTVPAVLKSRGAY